MNKTHKIMLAATAGLLALSLTGCSISLEDPKGTGDPTNPSSTSAPSGDTTLPNGQPGSSANPSASTPGSNPSASAGAGTVISLPKPATLPTVKPGDKPVYGNAATTTDLKAIIANSSAMADASGWYASFGGKVVGAFANADSMKFNSTYIITTYSQYPAGKAVATPAGVNNDSLILITAGTQFNVFNSLLTILGGGGTLTTFNAAENPLSDALFAAAAVPATATDVKPTTVKYGAGKYGKYGSTPNAYSVQLTPSASGALKDVTLWVEKVAGKDVIVGVNDVRVGYGSHPTAATGLKEYKPSIDSTHDVDSAFAMSLVGKYWVDRTTWWLTR